MMVVYLKFFILGLFSFEVNGRAINVSSSWFLPQEGFPVFYRYFNMKMTWNEAEAVCGFHHADLLSVQTGPQMDVARAYLKEIDVTDNIWIGLQKQSAEESFSWTNGEKLLGDGYWLEPFPKTNEKLCAAIDPVSDFRWNSYYCRGPQVASFVCELPVPDWAKKENGCMLTSMPSLLITYIPEMGIVQLFSDCGLDGTRRIACKGGVNREKLIQRLSCYEDIFGSTTFSKSTTDTVKEVNTQQSVGQNGNREANSYETTQAVRALKTNFPQTRHRRDANLTTEEIMLNVTQKKTKSSSDSTTVLESSTKITSTRSRGNVLKKPLLASPLLLQKLSEKNLSISNVSIYENAKIITTKLNEKSKSLEPTNPVPNKLKIVDPSLELSTVQKLPVEEITMKSSKESLQSTTNLKEASNTNSEIPPIPIASGEVPLLIITGETFNVTSSSGTSENPQIIFMINEKEGIADPNLVPLNEDVLINNPSLSPVEVIDVDLVGLENLTTTDDVKTLTINKIIDSDTESPPTKLPFVSHPLRIGEKKESNNPSLSLVVSSTLIPTIEWTSKMSPVNNYSTMPSKAIITNIDPEVLKEQLKNAIEEVKDIPETEIPQKPNRGRLLTHSSHPSFYPYFLNRILGLEVN